MRPQLVSALAATDSNRRRRPSRDAPTGRPCTIEVRNARLTVRRRRGQPSGIWNPEHNAIAVQGGPSATALAVSW